MLLRTQILQAGRDSAQHQVPSIRELFPSLPGFPYDTHPFLPVLYHGPAPHPLLSLDRDESCVPESSQLPTHPSSRWLLTEEETSCLSED